MEKFYALACACLEFIQVGARISALSFNTFCADVVRYASNAKSSYCLKTITSFLFFTSIYYSASSQDTRRYQEVNIASPNSASLGKFADIPVNYHTGIPNISIPLYTVENGPLKLPIGLSYHASGLKVTERASWVGAGWALETGGMITRTVMGSIDEWRVSTTSYFRDYGYYDYLYKPTDNGDSVLAWDDIAQGSRDAEPDLFFFNFNGYSGKFYFRGDRTPVLLSQQDIHIKPLLCENVSGCNTSSEYVYGFILTVPDGTRYHFGMALDGSQSVVPFERTSVFSDFPVNNMPSSWYLYKIESVDGIFTIGLKYEQENYSYYSLALFPESTTGGIKLTKNKIEGVRLKEITFNNGKVVFNPDINPREDLSATFGGLDDLDNTEAKALKSIDIKDDASVTIKSFVFDYEYFVDNGHPLKGILAPLETLHNLHTDKKRLKLKSVQEKGRNSEDKPAHVFTYQSGGVPRGLSFAQDHWGYYNGATDNEHLTPAISTTGTPVGPGSPGAANRETGWPSMANGILTKIQYPTGGHTSFLYGIARKTREECVTETNNFGELLGTCSSTFSGTGGFGQPINITTTAGNLYYYELIPSHPGVSGNYDMDGVMQGVANPINVTPGTHTFRAYAGVYPSGQGVTLKIWRQTRSTTCAPIHSYIGAMRIESITHNDGDTENDDITTTYKYEDGQGESTGVLFSQPNYAYVLKNSSTRLRGTNLFSVNGCRYTFSGGPFKYIVSPGSIHPMQTTQGNAYGYKEVRVIQSNGGYSIYKYHAPSTNLEDVSGRTINIYSCDPAAPEYPAVPAKHDPDRGKLEYEGIFTAQSQKVKETIYSTQYTEELFGVTGLKVQSVQDELWASEYEIKSAKKTFERVEERTYNSSAPADPPLIKFTETNYASKHHSQPTKITVSDAPGGAYVEQTRNLYVGDMSACSIVPECAQEYIDDWEDLYIPYQTNVNNCGSTDITCLKSLWQEYTHALNQRRKEYIACLKESNINDTHYQACLDAEYGLSDPESKPIIDLKKMNIKAALLETSVWKNGFLTGSMFIQYQKFNNAPRQLYPGIIYKLNPSLPLASTFTEANITDHAFIKDLRYTAEITLNYGNGNVVETKGIDGIPVSYIWGVNNTRPIVKAKGISYNTLNAAYSAVSGNLSTLRSQPSLSGALLSTYTYSPLEGMTSQTDANGITTYYTYDGLGRLKFIKDTQGNIVQSYRYNYKH